MLVAIGGGAGIAAIFKAPVGGMLYAMEVLEIEFGALAMFALVLGCLTASVTSMLLSGTPFDVSFGIRFPDNADIGWIMLLGVFWVSIPYGTYGRATKCAPCWIR